MVLPVLSTCFLVTTWVNLITVVNFCHVLHLKILSYKPMTRRKSSENNIRALRRLSGGSSYGITIPREFLTVLKWRLRQKLELKLYRDRIVISYWKPQPPAGCR